MRNRPTKRPGLSAPPREERAPVPEFTPVPRKYRHDGWTPERQKAFIEALADCGSVTRAAAMVDIGPEAGAPNCYTLRRAAGRAMASVNIGTIRSPHCLRPIARLRLGDVAAARRRPQGVS